MLTGVEENKSNTNTADNTSQPDNNNLNYNNHCIDYNKLVETVKDKPPVVLLVTGLRGCGKSTFIEYFRKLSTVSQSLGLVNFIERDSFLSSENEQLTIEQVDKIYEKLLQDHSSWFNDIQKVVALNGFWSKRYQNPEIQGALTALQNKYVVLEVRFECSFEVLFERISGRHAECNHPAHCKQETDLKFLGDHDKLLREFLERKNIEGEAVNILKRLNIPSITINTELEWKRAAQKEDSSDVNQAFDYTDPYHQKAMELAGFIKVNRDAFELKCQQESKSAASKSRSRAGSVSDAINLDKIGLNEDNQQNAIQRNIASPFTLTPILRKTNPNTNNELEINPNHILTTRRDSFVNEIPNTNNTINLQGEKSPTLLFEPRKLARQGSTWNLTKPNSPALNRNTGSPKCGEPLIMESNCDSDISTSEKPKSFQLN